MKTLIEMWGDIWHNMRWRYTKAAKKRSLSVTMPSLEEYEKHVFFP